MKGHRHYDENIYEARHMATAVAPTSLKLPFDDRPLWHKSAPRRLTKAFAGGDAQEAWATWQKHLARRKRPADPGFLAGKRPPLLWAWPFGWEREGIIVHGRSLVQLAQELAV